MLRPSALGVSQAIIGLTIVAVGTSLPELAATLSAVRRGEGEIAFGNIVGSNIFNILGILGVAAIITPMRVTGSLAGSDLLIMLGATALLLWAAFRHGRIGRIYGAAFSRPLCGLHHVHGGYSGKLIRHGQAGAAAPAIL